MNIEKFHECWLSRIGGEMYFEKTALKIHEKVSMENRVLYNNYTFTDIHIGEEGFQGWMTFVQSASLLESCKVSDNK